VRRAREAEREQRSSTSQDLAAALAAARRARAHAYAPYSGYRVGAALVTRRRGIYAGCNVENASFGATLCAERSALAAMIAAGDCDPVSCIVVTTGSQPAAPCGICRQVLVEFASDMRVFLVAEDDTGKILRRSTTRLGALLPHAFRLAQKKRGARPA
jgi:cytidine deaminase